MSVVHPPPADTGTLANMRHLESLAAAVRSPRPMEVVIGLVIAQISDVVPADATAVWLRDADNDLWYIGGARGLTRRASQISFKDDQTLHNNVGDHGEIVTNLSSTRFQRLYPEHDLIRSALYAPMKIAGRRVGLIALYRNNDDAFLEDDLRFVRTVGSQVGMAVSFAALEARGGKLAMLEERARLGSDLHDGILQILSSIRVYVRELRSSIDAIDASIEEETETAIHSALSQASRTASMPVRGRLRRRSSISESRIRAWMCAASLRLRATASRMPGSPPGCFAKSAMLRPTPLTLWVGSSAKRPAMSFSTVGLDR